MKTIDKIDSNSEISNIIFKYGILGSIVFIGVFLIMRALNLINIIELRAINFIAEFFISFFAIYNYKIKLNGKLPYLEGLLIGFFQAVVAYTLFSGFLYFYLKYYNHNFMVYLQQNAPFGVDLTPLSAALAVHIEGLAIGMIMSFILMQYLKSEPNTEKQPAFKKEVRSLEKEEV
jgi:hypothetical protein